MITLYDPFSTSHMHVPFNAGLIETAALAYPHESIRFYAERGYIQHVLAHLEGRLSPQVEFREIVIPDPAASNFGYFRQNLAAFRELGRESKAEVPGNNLLVMTFTNAIGLAALKFYLFFNRHFSGAQTMLHGDLADIDGWRSRNPLFRFWNLRGALSFFNLKRLRYIVLEQAIARKLTARMPELAAFIDVLPHAVPEEGNAGLAETLGLSLPVTIGYLGLVTKLKGFPIFRDIAEKAKRQLGEKVSFLAIGHTKGRPLPENIDCLDVKPKTDFLSRQEYTGLVARCHYICLPFARELYALSASGTLLDAIALRKPIIAFDAAVLEDAFRLYGDIGYLCTSPDEMFEAIENILRLHDVKRYREQQKNMEKFFTARQPAALAKIYRQITEGKFLNPRP
jgi:glycosyltransferase involved in cell wall biosynthesis